MRSRVLCANMCDMNLSHAKQRIAPISGKANDFRRPAIRVAKNSMICGHWRNAEARLTVKFRNSTLRNFLPSDLPSKGFAWGQ
jgi:hypothetical protein